MAPSPEDIARDLRQLALVDRIIGLEAELANLRMAQQVPTFDPTTYQRSITWRVGNAVLAPARVIRSVVRRGTRR